MMVYCCGFMEKATNSVKCFLFLAYFYKIVNLRINNKLKGVEYEKK